MAFEGNAGTNKLAKVLTKRMKQEGKSPLVLDFGEIQENGSLLTNTFPVPMPKGQYSVCRSLSYVTSGSRVLVAWVQNEAVVIDIITRS